MAYFAEINDSNIVTRVIAVSDKNTQDKDGNEVESIGAEFCNKLLGGGTWKQTSYNTILGIHRLGKTPLRVNYAGIGFTYDAAKDAFIPPQPYPSWILDEDICQWDAPVEYPSHGVEAVGGKHYKYDWNEETGAWNEI